ncbi:cytochrome d ubiquinol oxidase subunit II [Cellulomonas xylanilytica]|uniref:DUF4190 domain-containing protein n=1 Tax=Cellulomonas xylanilytica TaxID=233583 RepID=A0A510VAR5_9CELL|nr:cytochrome d ubiquinol oxidase subunit II [Cellulomonas xylanilytica]GEK22265.1 hypothetical protein CXY01_27850 [Cellulomonas xylanilytica]
MSNPYAPPENRPGTPDDAPAQEAPAWPPAGAPRPASVAPERPPADPEGTARATSLTRLFAVLVLASVLVATLRLPWQAAALPFALAAIVVGVRALVVAVRARARGLGPLLAVGLVISLAWTLLLSVQLALWPAQQDKQECLEGALTLGARSACETQFEKDLDDLRTSVEDRSTGS